MLELSDRGLANMENAVTTIFHEIHHHRRFRLTGDGGPEDAAENFGREMYQLFKKRMDLP